MVNLNEVIKFWFEDHDQKDWYGSTDEFDKLLHEKFFDLHGQVCAGEADHWRQNPQGRLAEIIVLDQFSRQFFRGKAQAFAYDGMALVLAQELVATGGDKTLTTDQRSFAYMPYMHSESLKIHEVAVKLFGSLDVEASLEFEIAHRDVIVRFGRFPKRNEALGRTSTKEEKAYIEERDESFF
ncbi:MAG: DUF924 domain-containing protein [Devosiaceae bacterium]|nr:DUF924 domain-containing protein [Devosiaceae bacterium]